MLCITFDNFGCASGKPPPCPFPQLVPPGEWDRSNEIGLTLGQPRILHLLERLKISTTYFAEGYAAVLHPEEMKRWCDAGHEIALHGWKHETWSSLPSEQHEDRVVALSVAAVTDLLGEAPVGIRPPGLRINEWTDAVMERHGIRYIAQSVESEDDPRLAAYGIDASAKPQVRTCGKLLACSPRLIDADLIAPASGGVFGKLDAEAAYDAFHDMALEHQRSFPDQPWVFTIHPFISGNRAWSALEKFLCRLHAEFGPGSFRKARDIALAV